MDQRYALYCVRDPLFYDSQSRVRESRVEFPVTRRAAAQGWDRFELACWVVHRPRGTQGPNQGWKIHVSACLDNAAGILEVVWDYCIEAQICFKFLRDRDALLLRNAKYAARGSSGKLVTIYPRDEAQLE